MASRKVRIELDEELIRRARDRVTGETGRAGAASDSEVIAEAVAAFLGFAALDEAHAQGGLPEAEADRLAVEEVRAFRAAQDHAA